MKRSLRKLASCLLLLAAAIPLWACGVHVTPEVIWLDDTHIKAAVTVDGEKKEFRFTVGQGGCVEWDIQGCGKGKLCGLQPGTPVTITCTDPVLMEWPSAWTLLSATWTAPSLGRSGSILVTPATSYVLPDSFGVLITDPGYSAYVLMLDAPGDIGPAAFTMEMTFLVPPGTGTACLKGIDVAVATVYQYPPVSFIVPSDPTGGVDFTAFGYGDPHTFCILGPSPAEEHSWGKIKSMYMDK